MPESPESEPNQRPLIAFIENDASVLRAARVVLSRAGFGIFFGQNGRDAIGIRFGNPEPDAMFVNWLMPGCSGDEAIRTIRRLEAERGYRRMPIVLESGDIPGALAQNPDMADVTDGILAKPFDGDQLVEMTRVLLDKAGRQS